MAKTAYVKMFHPGDEADPVECHSCGYPAPLKDFEGGVGMGGTQLSNRMLCEVCASTMIGNLTSPGARHDYDSMLLAQSLGNCTNRILDAIEGLKGDSNG